MQPGGSGAGAGAPHEGLGVAIYRPPRSRWPLAIAVGAIALVIGIAAGLLIDGGGDEAPDVAEVEAALFAAAGSVEVAAIEYEEAVSGGAVTSETEYEGARDALSSGRNRYDEVRGHLVEIAPERVDDIDSAFESAEALMAEAADADEVVAALEELEDVLKG